MNYKKIFRTRASRRLVLDLLRFVPNTMMLRLQYWIKTNRRLNLEKPQRYTEKLQWYKLNYRNPVMHQCVDKYQVRQYVKDKGLGDHLVKLLGVYPDEKHIPWDKLPAQFVLKTTNGSGGHNVVICHDKRRLDRKEAQKRLRCRPSKSRTDGREWAYYGLQPQIVAEELLINETDPQAGIDDYKILCYAGEPRFIIVDSKRFTNHKRNFFDSQWHDLHISSDKEQDTKPIPKPANLEEMLAIARRLAAGFPHVRVDLYSCHNQIYFGELTFYPWSGYVVFEPDQADYLLGADFPLQKYYPDN